jgi:hypothetical protein
MHYALRKLILGSFDTKQRKLFCYSFLLLVCICNLFSQEGGYVNPLSVTKGGIISFHISTSVSPFDLKIYKLGKDKQLISTFESIAGGVRQAADSSYWYGCGWPLTFELTVSSAWNSGIYEAEFPTSTGTRGVLFFVKENNPASHSKIVVSLAVNTWQAYNNFGGKSLYTSNSTDGKRSFKVSFNRPFTDTYGSGQYFNWAGKLVSWLQNENIPVEFTSSLDLDKDPGTLSNYSVLIIVGHDEYWSRGERNQVEKFLKNGGNLIILGGNTCWWQVRYEDEGRTMVCYKDSTLDPLFHVADSLVTVNWSQRPVNYPENLLTGVSYRNGGYVAYSSVLPKSLGYGDYTVYNCHHWIYNGTGLGDGDSFGWQNDIVGYEVDGALFNWQNGFPVVSGADESPVNYKVLGISPATNLTGTQHGHGTMGVFQCPGGGWVFNTATTDWADGLASDSLVQKITANIIHRFSSNKFPPEITAWTPSRVIADSIHHELVFLNRREFLVLPGDSLTMAVTASDLHDESLHYFWTQDGLSVSTGPSYTYRSSGLPINYSRSIIATNVFNSHDTSVINWIVYNSPLKIVSAPKTIHLEKSMYQYQLNVLNYFRDTLEYQLIKGPSWLGINNHGTISGEAPLTTGSFQIEAQVRNQHDQTDSQSFILEVVDVTTFAFVNGQLPSLQLFPNYPNPFNPSTNIRYEINERGTVRLEIYSELGQLVKTLHSNITQEAGIYTSTWDGFDDAGNQVSGGIYFLRLTVRPDDHSIPFVNTGKMILLK